MSAIAHSKIGASSMHRWKNCPGSVRLSEGIVSPSSSYAEEGTRAHELAAYFFEKLTWPPNSDPEMVEAVSQYTDLVLSERPRGSKLYYEHRFDLSSVYPGLFGTADAVVFDPKEKLLRVYDYKHGAGIAVDAVENEQLMYYALGALLSINAPCEEVEVVIVQPRCNHPDGVVRRWRFPSLALLDFRADLVVFASRTENPNAPLVSGDHCRFCPAAGICPTLREQAQIVAKNDFTSVGIYDRTVLAETLNKLPMLEAWIESVRKFAYGEAEHGRCPPGWKLVQKRAVRRWRNEEEVLSALGEQIGDELFEKKLKSPAQVEKILKGVELKELVVSESSGLTLAHESDKRPAVVRDAKLDFEVVTKQ